MSTTIRRNATKRISDILNACEFLRVFKYDDMATDENGEVTAADVIAAGQEFEFERVYLDEAGCLHCVINRNWSYTAYPSLEAARDMLTPPAVAKYRLMERIAEREMGTVSGGFVIHSGMDEDVRKSWSSGIVLGN